MIRKAVIIASPLKRGQPGFLPGVEMDVYNYKSFLTSPVGGSWLPSEIQVLWNPTKIKIAQVMADTLATYVFTAYSGHGGTDKKTGKDFLRINDKEAVWVNHLTAQSIRQLAIIDACSAFVDSGISGFAGPEPIEFNSSLTPTQARKIFDHQISSTPHGWTVVYSSSPGQSSIDAPEGGLFSQSLLRSAGLWGDKFEPHSILPIPAAYKHSFNYLKKVFKAVQTPRIKHSVANLKLPFAVRYGTELDR
jgi:hypothetical protein